MRSEIADHDDATLTELLGLGRMPAATPAQVRFATRRVRVARIKAALEGGDYYQFEGSGTCSFKDAVVSMLTDLHHYVQGSRGMKHAKNRHSFEEWAKEAWELFQVERDWGKKNI